MQTLTLRSSMLAFLKDNCRTSPSVEVTLSICFLYHVFRKDISNVDSLLNKDKSLTDIFHFKPHGPTSYSRHTGLHYASRSLSSLLQKKTSSPTNHFLPLEGVTLVASLQRCPAHCPVSVHCPVCVCDKNFVASVVQELIDRIS